MRAHYGDTQPQINLTVDTTATTGERKTFATIYNTEKCNNITIYEREMDYHLFRSNANFKFIDVFENKHL